MRFIAGVDIGNCNTEVVIARCDGDGPEPVWHDFVPTSGRKGSPTSLLGAADLLRRAEKDLGIRVELVALAQLRPVDTLSIPLNGAHRSDVPVRSLCRGASESPAGQGVGVGVHVPLDELLGDVRREPVVVSVPLGVDFEDAAGQLSSGWKRGWNIHGVLVTQNDAVLIHNRIPFDVPIVDEVDLRYLRTGDRVALEVVAPGVLRRTLADPMSLADALGLETTDLPRLLHVTRELSDASAIAVTKRWADDSEASIVDDDYVVCDKDGVLQRLGIGEAAQFLATAPPGTARSVRINSVHDGSETATADALVVDLSSADDGAWLRRGTVTLDCLVLAMLSQAVEVDAAELLSSEIDRNVVTVTDESTAAALGAGTTPAFSVSAAVCDVGAGTVDCVWGDNAATVAGGGEIVTLAVAAALAIPISLAEHVKRSASVRVTGPHLVHEEDGRRRFLVRAAPSESIGRLCVRTESTLIPFNDKLAPEEWRSLRLSLKQATVATNIARCFAAFPAQPTSVVMAGGGALDDELVRSVTEKLYKSRVVVGRANVAGQFGPRFAVAWGLVKFAYDKSI
jgi:hypothetical protein